MCTLTGHSFIHQRERRRHCPSTTTLPASQHKAKTKTLGQLQQCVILRLTTSSSPEVPASVQLSHRRAAAVGHHPTKGWERFHPNMCWHHTPVEVVSPAPAREQGCACIQERMMNLLSTGVSQVYVHAECGFIHPCAFRPP